MCGVSMCGLWKGCGLMLKPREDDPVAYNACDDASVDRGKLRAQVKSEDESHVEFRCVHVIELHVCLLLSATHPMHRQGSRQIILTLTAPTPGLYASPARRVDDSVQK